MTAPLWLYQKAAPAGNRWRLEGTFCPSPCPWEAVSSIRPVAPLFQKDRTFNPSLEAGVTLGHRRSSPTRVPLESKQRLGMGLAGALPPPPGLAATFHLDVQDLREAGPPSQGLQTRPWVSCLSETGRWSPAMLMQATSPSLWISLGVLDHLEANLSPGVLSPYPQTASGPQGCWAP